MRVLKGMDYKDRTTGPSRGLGAWCCVLGARAECRVSGAWCLVLCLVPLPAGTAPGTWHSTRHPAPGTWHEHSAPSTQHSALVSFLTSTAPKNASRPWEWGAV